MSDDPYKSFDHHIKAQEAEIIRLRVEQGEARGYLSRLLQSLYPSIEVLPDLLGVCTQIDNVLAGQREEIARLRAACDAYFTTVSLSEMRHGRILFGLERRIARQRRALTKLYQRRHEKNAALATARREGMEDAADLCDDLPDHQGGICAIAIRVMIDEEEKRAAIPSLAKEDNRPSEEIIREDRDAWPDHQANDPIRAAAGEGK